MDVVESVWHYFMLYGYYFLFLIVFLEYLNLPGLPAGIIMPAAGILIASQRGSFAAAHLVSVVAGLLGSTVLYLLGRFLDRLVLMRCYRRWPKLQPAVDKTMGYMERYGDKGVFVARLLPVFRTLISLAAGVLRVGFGRFVFFSVWGIAIWNFLFIFAGYWLGDALLPYLM